MGKAEKVVLGFHADNGSEYINKRVAKLLEKLRIEFTKSRPRHSNDNALAESKNGAIVRKVFGYAHLPQRWAPLINRFNLQHLNPYLNCHRPCFFPDTVTDAKGKQGKTFLRVVICRAARKWPSGKKTGRFSDERSGIHGALRAIGR